MGKDKKKYAKILGRLDSSNDTVTLVWKGGNFGIGHCEGGPRLCYECNKFRGVGDPVLGETTQATQWDKFKLPFNTQQLVDTINKATLPWKDRKVLVDVKLDPEFEQLPRVRFQRKYITKVRETSTMKLLPFVVPDSHIEAHEQHGVGRCECHIPLTAVINAAKSHRQEGKSLAKELSGTVNRRDLPPSLSLSGGFLAK
eukprot:TRINITY_DN2245_c0_g1_i1.p1 TRINITY_DN2245_c0_g1~~TRINITY_DN2245_c0_g1_i1.p1  ORF type:complete len:199 (-),score=27.54 TRINITY_DN2245_c0_g1_i1:99-695(-)